MVEKTLAIDSTACEEDIIDEWLMSRGKTISGKGDTGDVTGTIDDGKGDCDTDDTVEVNGCAKRLSESLVIDLMVVEETIDSSWPLMNGASIVTGVGGDVNDGDDDDDDCVPVVTS